MYIFTDTNQPASARGLSAESVKIGGLWLEEEIEGFRVLSTTGREALSSSVSFFSVGSRNGGKFKSRRYPEREIVVRYQLIADSSSDFREKYNHLAKLLNVEEVQIIFNDETDKYFTGTPEEIGKVEAGTNSVIGEFTIICLDPFKYDLEERTVTAVNGVMNINYDGTLGVYPKLHVDMAARQYDGEYLIPGGETAYLAYFADDGRSISLGDSSRPAVSTLIDTAEFSKSLPSRWHANNIELTSSLFTAPVGTVGIATHNGRSALTQTNYGTGSAWHGPNVDSEVFFGNRFTAKARMEISCLPEKQRMLSFIVRGVKWSRPFPYTTGTAAIVAGVRIAKWEVGKSTAALQFVVNDRTVASRTININGISDVIIQKIENSIIFEGFGERYVHVCSTEENQLEGHGIMFVFNTYGTDTLDGDSTYQMVHSVDVYDDPPTGHSTDAAFYSGDTVDIDVSNGFIYKDGTFSPQFGDPSNDWEVFMLKPGENLIRTAYSSWTTRPPTFRLSYRGRYI